MATDGRPILADGHADESTIDAMAGGTSVMRLRIPRDNSATDGAVASRAVGVHTDHGVMVHAGVIIDKAAMTG